MAKVWANEKTYLPGHRSALYSHLLLYQYLYPHVLAVDQAANELLAKLAPQIAKSAVITEQLTISAQMRRVGLMNIVKAPVEEIIFIEAIPI